MFQTNAPFVEPPPRTAPGSRRNDGALRLPAARQLVFPPPGHGFTPTGLNDAGDIIGNLIHPSRFTGASWSASGLFLPPHHLRNQELPTAEMAHPFAALNASGVVVGTRGESAKSLFAWASHRGDFGAEFWPHHLSFAQDVNASGDVVGKMMINADPVLVSRAFLISASGTPRYFDPPEGGLTDAIAINDSGTVLFAVTPLSTRTASQRAWLWHGEEFIPLSLPPRCSSRAIALNEANQVVGFIETEFGLRRPVLWTEGRPLDLNTRESQDFCPTCITDDGIVGGTALDSHARRSACIWTSGKGLQFLEDLQPASKAQPLDTVVAINAGHQILASRHTGHQSVGLLLDPQG